MEARLEAEILEGADDDEGNRCEDGPRRLSAQDTSSGVGLQYDE